jgi:hypothetical protein
MMMFLIATKLFSISNLIEKPELGNQSKDIENHVSPFA